MDWKEIIEKTDLVQLKGQKGRLAEIRHFIQNNDPTTTVGMNSDHIDAIEGVLYFLDCIQDTIEQSRKSKIEIKIVLEVNPFEWHSPSKEAVHAAVKEAVDNALTYAEGHGFDHMLSDSVSIGVQSIEVLE